MIPKDEENICLKCEQIVGIAADEPRALQGLDAISVQYYRNTEYLNLKHMSFAINMNYYRQPIPIKQGAVAGSALTKAKKNLPRLKKIILICGRSLNNCRNAII